MYKCTPLIKSQLSLLVDNKESIVSLPESKPGSNDYEYLIITTDALKNSFGLFMDYNSSRCLRTKVVTVSEILSLISSGIDTADNIRRYIIMEYEYFNIVYVLLAGDADSDNQNGVPSRGFISEVYANADYYKYPDIPIPGLQSAITQTRSLVHKYAVTMVLFESMMTM